MDGPQVVFTGPPVLFPPLLQQGERILGPRVGQATVSRQNLIIFIGFHGIYCFIIAFYLWQVSLLGVFKFEK